MKIKLNAGIDVRTGPDNEDGTVPTRRIGEKDDVINLSDVPEWEGKIPHWLIKHGAVEEVKPKAKGKAPARKK